MAINVANPDDRRADLVAALKTLMQPEWDDAAAQATAVQALYDDLVNEAPLIVDDAAWSPAPEHRWREVWLSGTCAITLPNNTALPLGYSIAPRRLGVGEVTFAVGAGGVLLPAGVGRISARYLSATATVVAISGGAVTWVIEGAVL